MDETRPPPASPSGPRETPTDAQDSAPQPAAAASASAAVDAASQPAAGKLTARNAFIAAGAAVILLAAGGGAYRIYQQHYADAAGEALRAKAYADVTAQSAAARPAAPPAPRAASAVPSSPPSHLGKARQKSRNRTAARPQAAAHVATRPLPGVDALYRQRSRQQCECGLLGLICREVMKVQLCRQHNAYGKAAICPSRKSPLP